MLACAALITFRSSGAGVLPVIIAGLIALVVMLYLNRTLKRSRTGLVSPQGALILIVSGFALFLLSTLPLRFWADDAVPLWRPSLAP